MFDENYDFDMETEILGRAMEILSQNDNCAQFHKASKIVRKFYFTKILFQQIILKMLITKAKISLDKIKISSSNSALITLLQI